MNLPPGMDLQSLNNKLPDAVVSNTQPIGPDQTSRQKFTRETLAYDNPFLDMTSTFIPARYKDVLRILAAFVLNHGIVNQTIARLSEYPLTDLIYGDDDDIRIKKDHTVDFWKNILEDVLNIKEKCKQTGIDYHAYGNSFVSLNFPFRRELKCPHCGKRFDAVAHNARYRQYRFHAVCPGCKVSGPMDAKDIPTKEINKLSIVHWDILQIDIKYNTITGEHFYYYTPDKELRRQVSRGDMDIINGLRMEVLDAIRTNKKLRLNKANVFHYKRIGPQYVYPQERGWGISAVMPALKDLFHIQVLKKANEMIAFDRINPLRVLYPNATGEVSPHAMMDLGQWKSKIEDEILKWRTDPNHVAVMPIPVGMEDLLGDGKVLMVHQEIKFVEDTVITSLGIIPELIRGGASWSGSSVSLRVVENGFINYRTDMQHFIDFIVKQIAHYFKQTKIDVKFSDFKMADDIQQKQMILNAAMGPRSSSMLSQSTVIKELGFDPEVEYNNKLQELNRNAEIALVETKAQAEAAGAAAVVQALFQADAQVEGQDRMNVQQAKAMQKQDMQRQQQAQQSADGMMQDVFSIMGKASNKVNVPELIMLTTRRAKELQINNPTEFEIRMLAMKNSTPNLYAEVYKNLKEMNVIKADTMPNIEASQLYTPGTIPVTEQGGETADGSSDPAEAGLQPGAGQDNNSAPLPEQKPPTREGGSPM